jgi:hypothetical protein
MDPAATPVSAAAYRSSQSSLCLLGAGNQIRYPDQSALAEFTSQEQRLLSVSGTGEDEGAHRGSIQGEAKSWLAGLQPAPWSGAESRASQTRDQYKSRKATPSPASAGRAHEIRADISDHCWCVMPRRACKQGPVALPCWSAASRGPHTHPPVGTPSRPLGPANRGLSFRRAGIRSSRYASPEWRPRPFTPPPRLPYCRTLRYVKQRTV